MKKFGFALLWSFLVTIYTLPCCAPAALAGGPGWEMAAAVNSCGQGGKDVLRKNVAPGEVALRHMWGNGLIGERKISIKSYSVAWSVAGGEDFDRDGPLDILRTDLITGQQIVWYRKGCFLQDGASLESFAPLWKIVCLRYFDHDGWPEIFWKNSHTGKILFRYRNGPLTGEVVFGFAARAPPAAIELASLNGYVYACPGNNWKHIVKLRFSRPLRPADEPCDGVLCTGLYTRDSPTLRLYSQLPGR